MFLPPYYFLDCLSLLESHYEERPAFECSCPASDRKDAIDPPSIVFDWRPF